ncbi:MAG TPA: HD domain-containing protein [Syntrophomonas sp.]|nr:HD domain-containing protein [Syntrophomonas sp.]HRW11644.1 HD domain-containing protein [Syntrophomonas sp.]
MENNKKLMNVREMQASSVGQQVSGKFLILDKIYRKTKDGKDMYNLKLGDGTGEIDAVVWENCRLTGTLTSGEVIGILGDMGNFSGRNQITAKIIKVLDEDPGLYMKQAENLEQLKQHFQELVKSLRDPHLQNLSRRIFDPSTQEVFFRAPAAKRIHHNYPGGLLEHSCQVADLALKMADSYAYLNKDLLLFGALVHDIGKIMEYKMGASPQYTTEGKLLGHIVMGSEMISIEINRLRTEGYDFPQNLEWMIKHMILSHHGSMEFGSPVIPLFPEAFVLHVADNLDAKMYIFKNKLQENNGEEEYFTNYDTYFAQQFFTYRYPVWDEMKKTE